MSWASNHDASVEKLDKVQGSLTVDLMMIPRKAFLCCTSSQMASEVKTMNEKNFSTLPVEDENRCIVGLYDAERWFNVVAPGDKIGSDFTALSENTLIGADASIFEFIKNADFHPTNLVVSGNRIVGLISISDLQQLPVRAALFALITSLEMAMTLAMDVRWGENAEAWLAILGDDRQKGLRKAAIKAQKQDSFISYSTLTTFGDKSNVIQMLPSFKESITDWSEILDNLRILRNTLAHANEYADTPEKATSVCSLVRGIFEIKGLLLKTVTL